MTTDYRSRHKKTDSLGHDVWLLAHIEPTDSPFISCYLDLTCGKEKVMEFLSERKSYYRDNKFDISRPTIDHAFEEIVAKLDSTWPGSKSAAIFLRSFDGGGFDKIMEFNAPVKNEVTIGTVPDIAPLVALRHRYNDHLMVTVTEKDVVIHDMGFGISDLYSWEKFSQQASDSSRVATVVNLITTAMRRRHRKIMIFGLDDYIHSVYQALPRMLRKRVINVLPLNSEDTDHKIQNISWITYRRNMEHHNGSAYRQAMEDVLSGSNMAGGLSETVQALKAGIVSSLYIAQQQQRTGLYYRQQMLEILRLAIQQSVPIKFMNSAELEHEYGGVCCMTSSDVSSSSVRYSHLATRGGHHGLNTSQGI